MRLKLLKATNLGMMFAFLLSATVQYNDPDPFRWIAIYALAAVACLLFHIHRCHWGVSAAIGGVALIWAISLLPAVFENTESISMGGIFGSAKMKTIGVEFAREVGGLMIVVCWMGFIASLALLKKEPYR